MITIEEKTLPLGIANSEGYVIARFADEEDAHIFIGALHESLYPIIIMTPQQLKQLIDRFTRMRNGKIPPAKNYYLVDQTNKIIKTFAIMV